MTFIAKQLGGSRRLFDLTHSPAGLWRLQSDGSDVSGNGNNLSAVGTPEYNVGSIGRAFEQTGTVRWTSASVAALQLTNAVTVMCWVRMNSYSGTQKIFTMEGSGESEANNVLYSIDFVSGQIRYRHEYGAGTNEEHAASGVLIPEIGEWFMITLRKNADGLATDVLINDAVVYEPPVANVATGGSGSILTVGGNFAGSGEYLDGRIQDLRIVAAELTLAQIQAEYDRFAGVVR